MLGLPRLQPAQARARHRARPRRDHDPLVDGLGLPDPRALSQELRHRPGPAGGGGPGHRRAPRQLRARLLPALLRPARLPGAHQLHRQLQRGVGPTGGRAEGGLERAQPLLQHDLRRGQRPDRRRAVVAAGRLRADARLERPALRLIRLSRRHRPRQRLGDHRHPRPRLFAPEQLLAGHCPSRHTGGRARHDQRDRVPPPHLGADGQHGRVPRLLAAGLLHRLGRRHDRRVLGLPREGRDHGPLPAAQVGGARPRRRDADPARDHPGRAQALDRAGHLHGRLQRDRRHARRRHRLSPRRRQLPIRGRRRVHRRAPEQDRRRRGDARLHQALDRPAPQRRRAGAGEPRDPQGDRLDAARSACPGGAEVVPAADRAHRRLRRDPDRDLTHRATRASSGTRSGATPATAPRSGTRSGPRASRTAWPRWGCRRSTCCGSSRG